MIAFFHFIHFRDVESTIEINLNRKNATFDSIFVGKNAPFLSSSNSHCTNFCCRCCISDKGRKYVRKKRYESLMLISLKKNFACSFILQKFDPKLRKNIIAKFGGRFQRRRYHDKGKLRFKESRWRFSSQ